MRVYFPAHRPSSKTSKLQKPNLLASILNEKRSGSSSSRSINSIYRSMRGPNSISRCSSHSTNRYSSSTFTGSGCSTSSVSGRSTPFLPERPTPSVSIISASKYSSSIATSAGAYWRRLQATRSSKSPTWGSPYSGIHCIYSGDAEQSNVMDSAQFYSIVNDREMLK